MLVSADPIGTPDRPTGALAHTTRQRAVLLGPVYPVSTNPAVLLYTGTRGAI